MKVNELITRFRLGLSPGYVLSSDAVLRDITSNPYPVQQEWISSKTKVSFHWNQTLSLLPLTI